MSSLDPQTLTVRFRGVRGSIPTPGTETARYGGNTSCVELRSGGEILILDAGTGIRSLGADLSKEFGSRSIVANLLISHTHWDHIQGLPFFSPLYAAQNRIQVIGANGSPSALEQGLRNQMQALHFPVALDQMRGLNCFAHLNSSSTQLGEFRVEVIALNHPGGCAGFRVSAQGATVAYLPDHEPYRYSRVAENGLKGTGRRDALIDFVRGTDLLILDTQYTESEYRERVGWGHGCLTDSVALAIDAGVRHLMFFHHDPSHQDGQIDKMVKDARKLAKSSGLAIGAAAEKRTVVLDAKRKNGYLNGRSPRAFADGLIQPFFVTAARRKVSFRR